MSEKITDFWREIKTSSNSNITLPNIVGNVRGSQNISGMWQEHYSQIFSVVKGSYNKECHAEICKEN